MEVNGVHAIYFSPALSTKKIVKAVAEGISPHIVTYDITQGVGKTVFLDNSIVVIGVPAYYGRVPSLAKEHLSQFKANGTPAILVCVTATGSLKYLLELQQIVPNPYLRLSARELLCETSIFTNVGRRQTDTADLEAAGSLEAKSEIQVHKTTAPAGQYTLSRNLELSFCTHRW